MRVATFNQFNTNRDAVARIQGNMTTMQNQLATGKKFTRPSENPVIAKQAEVINQALKRVEQHKSNINDAKGMLETTETTLMNIYDVLNNTNQEMLKAANGTNTDSDLATIAGVIDVAIKEVTELANTKHLGRFVFSGDKTLTKPFDYDGNSVIYSGGSGEVKFLTANFSDVVVNEDASQYLQSVFDNLIDAKNKLFAGNGDISNEIANLKTGMDGVIDRVSNVGVKMDGLNRMDESMDDQKLNLELRLSNVQDADFLDVIVDYTMANNTYSATLQATMMMMKNSILDYM